MRHVEPGHRHVDTAAKDLLRGLGIRPDVELGRRGDVPLADRTTHEHDPLDAVATMRGEVASDVRQRPGRDERDGAVRFTNAVGDERDRVVGDRGARRRRKRRPVQAALAVHVSRDREVALERSLGSCGNSMSSPPDELEHPQRVRSRLLERLVAVCRRHAE